MSLLLFWESIMRRKLSVFYKQKKRQTVSLERGDLSVRIRRRAKMSTTERWSNNGAKDIGKLTTPLPVESPNVCSY